MKTRVAINGFGRIGRNAFKIAFDRQDLEIVAINDLTDTKTLAYLLKNDTAYGQYKYDVSSDDEGLMVNGSHILVTAEKEPQSLPWGNLDVDVVIESTGRFTKTEDARGHIKAGAKKVVISAPAKDEETKTVVIGVNENELKDLDNDIISNASCTTNSIAALMDIMNRIYGVDKAMLTTIHSFTASQALQDAPAKDLREGRAASQNIVPTTTGAAKAVALAVPAMKNKFDGLSVRVPTPVVSLSDVTMVLNKETTIDEINDSLKKEIADPYYQGILSFTNEPLVSSDFIGNSSSGIIDTLLTNVVGGNLAKVVVWYDNEWGYSNRLVELVADIGTKLHENI